MEWVVIKGKTLKGKNKIKEAGTDEWVVIDESETVQFPLKRIGFIFYQMVKQKS